MSTTHGKPIEGMECYCNMEDITEEDGNYGTNTYTMYTTTLHSATVLYFVFEMNL